MHQIWHLLHHNEAITLLPECPVWAGPFGPTRDFAATSGHNPWVRSPRVRLLVVLLSAGLLAALPGVAETIERLPPGDDCTEDCPADAADGKCGTSCDQCACCARTMSAVLVPYPKLGSPWLLAAASPTVPIRTPLALPEGVYHPPRA